MGKILGSKWGSSEQTFDIRASEEDLLGGVLPDIIQERLVLTNKAISSLKK